MLAKVTDGNTAIVYCARATIAGRRTLLAVKVPKWPRDRSLQKSLACDVERTRLLAYLHIPHAQLIAHGPDYVIKLWVEGKRGDRWYVEWVRNGCLFSDQRFKGLMQLFTYLSGRGIYIKNLKGSNLIWDGTVWVIIDPGPISACDGQTSFQKLIATFDNRWWKELMKLGIPSAKARGLISLASSQ